MYIVCVYIYIYRFWGACGCVIKSLLANHILPGLIPLRGSFVILGSNKALQAGFVYGKILLVYTRRDTKIYLITCLSGKNMLVINFNPVCIELYIVCAGIGSGSKCLKTSIIFWVLFYLNDKWT